MQSDLKQLICDFKLYIEESFRPQDSIFGTPIAAPAKRPAPPPQVAAPPLLPPPKAPPKKVVAPAEPPPLPKREVEESQPVERPAADEREKIMLAPALQAGPSSAALEQWRPLLQKIAPTLRLYEQPSDDREARRVKESYKERALAPVVALLISDSLRRYRPFLQNLAQAISCAKAPCRLIDVAALEGDNKWENFLSAKHMRLAICPDQLLFTLPHLMTHYKEFPQKRQRSLDRIPLLLLPDLSIYTKDPMLKRSLWTLICQTLDS